MNGLRGDRTGTDGSPLAIAAKKGLTLDSFHNRDPPRLFGWDAMDPRPPHHIVHRPSPAWIWAPTPSTSPESPTQPSRPTAAIQVPPRNPRRRGNAVGSRPTVSVPRVAVRNGRYTDPGTQSLSASSRDRAGAVNPKYLHPSAALSLCNPSESHDSTALSFNPSFLSYDAFEAIITGISRPSTLSNTSMFNGPLSSQPVPSASSSLRTLSGETFINDGLQISTRSSSQLTSGFGTFSTWDNAAMLVGYTGSSSPLEEVGTEHEESGSEREWYTNSGGSPAAAPNDIVGEKTIQAGALRSSAHPAATKEGSHEEQKLERMMAEVEDELVWLRSVIAENGRQE